MTVSSILFFFLPFGVYSPSFQSFFILAFCTPAVINILAPMPAIAIVTVSMIIVKNSFSVKAAIRKGSGERTQMQAAMTLLLI